MRTNRISILIASTVVTAAVVAGCASSSRERERESESVQGRAHEPERLGATQQPFDSNDAVLLDFDIAGTLVASTAEPAALRTLIQTQLLYGIGALNQERSLGRYERLELSAITATPKDGSGSFQVTYRAKLPVAWGGAAQPPAYALVLPARAARADQLAFATKYGKTCVDPSAGEIGAADAGRMFLNYRPQRAGCVLDPADVVTLPATVAPSTENTAGKYPEYHRMWEDGALDVVALFSHSSYEGTNDDFGARAFLDFGVRIDAYLAQRQPDATKRSATPAGVSPATHAATLPDGRTVRIDVSLVGARLAQEGAPFDAWYDALTPRADVILYSGHADLGENVHTIMNKGAFVPGKYVLWVENACDTFAYVDRTLADRRAALNPDDVHGTRYLDTVSTVLGGYFGTGPPTAMSILDAMIGARDPASVPKTFRQIFAELDPEQVTVVTGEEDNEFTPSMFSSPAGAAPGAVLGDGGAGMATPPATGAGAPSAPAPSGSEAPSPSSGGSCSAAAGTPRSGPAGEVAFVVALASALVMRRFFVRRAKVR